MLVQVERIGENQRDSRHIHAENGYPQGASIHSEPDCWQQTRE